MADRNVAMRKMGIGLYDIRPVRDASEFNDPPGSEWAKQLPVPPTKNLRINELGTTRDCDGDGVVRISGEIVLAEDADLSHGEVYDVWVRLSEQDSKPEELARFHRIQVTVEHPCS